ncbi:MAG: hypothetical protein KBT02_04080 [Treponema sp.]|nr:hypothetical protein [Candidatus Treponema caballi]
MRKSILLFCAVLCAALVMFSCTPVSDCGRVATVKDEFGKSTLTIGIGGVNARSILPDDWNDTHLNNIRFRLSGTSASGKTVPNDASSVYTYESIAANGATIALDPEVWTLTLKGYQVNGDNEYLVLESPAYAVDLTEGSTAQVFFLRPAAPVTGANGEVNLTVSFNKPANFGSVTYGLYTINGDGDSVAVTVGETVLEWTANNDSGLTNGNSASNFKFIINQAGIQAGTYYVIADFKDTNNQTIYYYSDEVLVDGGNITSELIDLTDANFGSAPVAASNFHVSYSYTGNGIGYNDLSAIPATYSATFTWNDNSNNERRFELIIKDSDNASVDVQNATTAGGLGLNKTSVTITLDPAKVYSATLRPVNSYSPADVAAEPDGYVCSLTGINLYTVTYNLDGGQVQTTNGPVSGNYYVVSYYNGQTPSLLGATGNYPIVSKTGNNGSFNFVNWLDENNENHPAVTSIPADNTGNISLKAKWTANLTSNVQTYSYSSVTGNLLSKTLNDVDGGVISNNGKITIDTFNTTGSEVNNVLVLTPVSGIANVSYKLYENYNTLVSTEQYSDYGFSVGDDNAVTWTITGAETGNYRLVVTATEDDGSSTETNNFGGDRSLSLRNQITISVIQ